MPVILRWFLRLWATNPIAVRLVQSGSRRTKHMYIRSAYLAVLIVVLLWLLLVTSSQVGMSYRKLASSAAEAFTVIAYLQIFLICVLAPVFMGGAIAQEANPRTWEVLLTTPLSAAQIVLGNLFGRLFFVFALLLCSLPLFALTQYFGGVPGSAIFASYAISGCAALLVGAIAIALSVSRAAGKRAFFVFYVCVVSYIGLTIALDTYLGSTQRGVNGNGVTVLTALNPFLSLYALLNPTKYPRAEEGTYGDIRAWLLEAPVTTWCIGSAALSVVFMAASAITVRLGGLGAIGGVRSGVPWYRRMFGLGGAGAEHRPPRAVWTNPIAWREAAARNATLGKIIARWVFVALGGSFGVGLVVALWIQELTVAEFQLAVSATVWIELAVITLVAINVSGTAVSREREDGTLDLLLTTPITASSYLTGKLRGLIAYLLPLLAVPIGTIAVAGAFVLAGGFGEPALVQTTATVGTVRISSPSVLPEAGILAPIVIIPFMAFCVMVGLNWSLRSKGTIGSVVATILIVTAISGIVGLCGWEAGKSIPIAGPTITALSPASLIHAFINPADAMAATVGQIQLAGARVSLFVGALLAAGVYAAICYGIHSNMVRTFDVTVRKLAGVK